jgi:hypothetical protein
MSEALSLFIVVWVGEKMNCGKWDLDLEIYSISDSEQDGNG